MRSYAWLAGGVGLLLSLGFLVLAGSEDLPHWALWMGGLGLLGMILAVVLEYSNIVELFTHRHTQLDLRAGALVACMAGVAIGLNVMAEHMDRRWDLESSPRLSLSDQTIELLSALDAPIRMDAFVTIESEEEILVDDLVALIEAHTSRFEVRIIDPIRQPSLARERDIGGNELVFEYEDRTERMSLALADQGFESAFRSAFIRVTNPTVHPICFSDGHGEPDIDEDMEGEGFGILDLALAQLNYSTHRVELLNTGEIPDTCRVFLATAMSRDWTEDELDALRRYLARGGQVLALPYLPGTDMAEDDPQPYIKQLPVEFNSALSNYGIWVGPTPIEEYSEANRLPDEPHPSTFLVSRPGRLPHPIVDSLDQSIVVQRTPPLGAIETEGALVTPFLSSTGSSRARQALSEDGSWTILEGPIPIGVTMTVRDADSLFPDIEDAVPGGRMVVLGSPSVASNGLVRYPGASNLDLVMNSIAWLAGEYTQLAGRYETDAPIPPMLSDRELTMVRNIVLLFVPGLALLGAIGTWRRRRRL